MTELKTTFSHYYPENSIGGECAAFAEKLEQFGPVGNTLASKTAYVKKHGILFKDLGGHFEIGDVVILDAGTPQGHVFIVNDIPAPRLQATESNWNLDHRVHHTRIVPVSNKIVGVLRGCPLKVVIINPPVMFPIQIPITLLMNNQLPWQSLIHQMAMLQDFYWTNSEKKIELIIDYKDTHLSGWPTVFTGTGTGLVTEIIEPNYFKNTIMPLVAHTGVFVMRKSDFNGGVFNGTGYETGFSYFGAGYGFRGAFVAMDEQDDYQPVISGLTGLSKIIAHELSHQFYKLGVNTTSPCGGRNYTLPEGTDLTHAHYYGEVGYPQKFADIFQDFDYSKIN